MPPAKRSIRYDPVALRQQGDFHSWDWCCSCSSIPYQALKDLLVWLRDILLYTIREVDGRDHCCGLFLWVLALALFSSYGGYTLWLRYKMRHVNTPTVAEFVDISGRPGDLGSLWLGFTAYSKEEMGQQGLDLRVFHPSTPPSSHDDIDFTCARALGTPPTWDIRPSLGNGSNHRLVNAATLFRYTDYIQPCHIPLYLGVNRSDCSQVTGVSFCAGWSCGGADSKWADKSFSHIDGEQSVVLMTNPNPARNSFESRVYSRSIFTLKLTKWIKLKKHPHLVGKGKEPVPQVWMYTLEHQGHHDPLPLRGIDDKYSSCGAFIELVMPYGISVYKQKEPLEPLTLLGILGGAWAYVGLFIVLALPMQKSGRRRVWSWMRKFPAHVDQLCRQGKLRKWALKMNQDTKDAMATDIDEESRDAERQNCPDTVTLLDAAELELPSVQERLKRTERLLRMLLMNAEPFYMTRAIQNMEDQLKQAEVRVKDLHTGFTVPMPQEQVEGLVQRLKDEEKQLENEEKQLRHLTRGPMLEYQVQHLHKLKEQLDALFERIRSMQERVEQCSQLGQ